jgi:signal transduction histidine kinase
MRRRAKLFDTQAEAIDLLTATAYQIRNAARELLPEDRPPNIDDVAKSLHSLSDEFILQLTQRRSVLPNLLFETIHELRTPMRTLLVDLDRLKAANPEERKAVFNAAQNEVAIINAIYNSFVDLAQMYRGVDADSKNPQ